MSRLILAPLALLLAAPAIAQDDGASTGENPAAEKKICREYLPTGSRLGKVKVCKTKAEWADERMQLRNQVDKTQTQRTCVQQYNC